MALLSKETFVRIDRNIDIPLSLGFITFGIIAQQYLGIIGGGLGLMRALLQRRYKTGSQGYGEPPGNGHEVKTASHH